MSDPASTRDLDDTDEWIMNLRNTPLRSIEDIREDREPEWVEPVLALGMQREYPQPPKLFRPPRWWHLHNWLLWNFGDVFNIWGTNGPKPQKKPRCGRHRLVRGMPEAAVYRPKSRQEDSQAASSAQERLPVPRATGAVSRWLPASTDQARARHS